jgi:hypothetical protein
MFEATRSRAQCARLRHNFGRGACASVRASAVLFVIRDAAALIADASLNGLLDGGLARFRETIVHRRDGSFLRPLNSIEGSLAYRIVAKLKGPNIDADHAGTWKCRELAVRRIEASKDRGREIVCCSYH